MEGGGKGGGGRGVEGGVKGGGGWREGGRGGGGLQAGAMLHPLSLPRPPGALNAPTCGPKFTPAALRTCSCLHSPLRLDTVRAEFLTRRPSQPRLLPGWPICPSGRAARHSGSGSELDVVLGTVPPLTPFRSAAVPATPGRPTHQLGLNGLIAGL